MKKGLFYALALTGVFASSCSDHDNVYDPDYSKKQYEENWKEKMGDIDPNQTWNMATLLKAEVKLAEDATVGIYIIVNEIPYELATYSLKSGSTNLSLDIPQGVDKVYVIKDSESDHKEIVASVNGGAITADFTSISSRAITSDNYPTTFEPSGPTKLTIDNGKWYTTTNPKDNSSGEVYGFADEYYATGNWMSKGGFKKINSETEDIESKYPFALDVLNKILAAEGTKLLESYVGPVNGLVKTDGPVTLTYVGGNTDANSAVGYFYTTKENPTAEDIKGYKKYIAVPGNKGCEHNDKFWLTYYGEDGNGTASFTFPQGTYIHFFLLRGNKSRNLNATVTAGTETPSSINGFYQFFSEGKELGLNTAAVNRGGSSFTDADITAGFSDANTRAVSVGDVNVITFEDWLQTGSIDWNDFAFVLEGNFEKFPPISKTISWTIAYEDLGSTEDFDFNDVVLRVVYKTTIEDDGAGQVTEHKAHVFLCAAGGTIPAYVYYDGKPLGEEVHAALLNGASSSPYPMINTGQGITADEVFLGEIDEADFNLSENGLKFSIKVEGRAEGISIPSASGEYPQAICIFTPENWDGTTWAWPMERVNLYDAYPEIGEWGKNYLVNTDWYLHPSSEPGKIWTSK